MSKVLCFWVYYFGGESRTISGEIFYRRVLFLTETPSSLVEKERVLNTTEVGTRT